MRYRCFFSLITIFILIIQALPSEARERRLIVMAPPGTQVQLDNVFIGEISAAGRITITLPATGGRILALKSSRRVLRTEVAVMPNETLTITADIAGGSITRNTEPTIVETVTRLSNPLRRAAENAPILQAIATEQQSSKAMDASVTPAPAPLLPPPPPPVLKNGKNIPRFSRQTGVALKAIPAVSAVASAEKIAVPVENKSAAIRNVTPEESSSPDWKEPARQLTRQVGSASRRIAEQVRSGIEKLNPGEAITNLTRKSKRVLRRSRHVLTQGKKALQRGKQALKRVGTRLRRLAGLEKKEVEAIPLTERVEAINVSAEFRPATTSADEPLSPREKAENLMENGNQAQAAHWFKQARQEEPDNPWLAYNEALCLGNSGNPEAGLELAVTTLPQAGNSLLPRLRKGIAILHYQRGQKRMNSGDLPGAALDIQTAERMLPGIDEQHLQEQIQARLTQQAKR